MTRRVLWPRDPFDRIVLLVHETRLHQWDPEGIENLVSRPDTLFP
jgi:hypothetical protein